MQDRTFILNNNFFEALKKDSNTTVFYEQTYPKNLSSKNLLSLFESQIYSRHLDFKARVLKEKNLSYYTIGSFGHEGNAVLGQVFPYTDTAFLHYRSCSFMLERSKQKDFFHSMLKDILLSLMASKSDPISAGRHKVFGSKRLNVPPQTSTIASHLPKAVGAAISIIRAKDLKLRSNFDPNSIILCSFGDASLNHASAQSALNAAQWISFNNYPLPIVFICEDNGIGISVKTPSTWVENNIKSRKPIHYISCNGLDLIDTYNKSVLAQNICREKKQAVFLHFKCVRLLGHAGSDIETQYHDLTEIKKNEAHDPIIKSAHLMIARGILSKEEVLNLYIKAQDDIEVICQNILPSHHLSSAHEVMQSIHPKRKQKSESLPHDDLRKTMFGKDWKKQQTPRNLSQMINLALSDLLLQYKNAVIFGEDVAKKGGVYRVTANLLERFGQKRVFDTILDETIILGTAIGMAHNNFLPIPEIQFLAYFHNAEDQIRSEASSLSFFSDGQYCNPMLVRIPSYAYQKGFGGHFHNDNSFAVLRDIPGVIIASPSNGNNAARALRQCFKLAWERGLIVFFLEPIALYMTKDLIKKDDEKWLSTYPHPKETLPFGETESYDLGGDIAIISYANGYFMARQAQEVLNTQFKIKTKTIDIIWLKPLPKTSLEKELKNISKILIVDECRKTASVSEELFCLIKEHFVHIKTVKRITAEDSFIPLGNSAYHVLPTKEDIINEVKTL